MRYPRQAPHVHQCDVFSSMRHLARLLTTSMVFACMLWLGFSTASASSQSGFVPVTADLGPGVDLAWSSPAEKGQISFGLGDVKLNIEAYNKKREKDIADDSRKLLSLAIALNADLERSSGSALSSDTINKAKQIEKLAHDVKENMKINLVVPQ
jgi:hypothetical protein